MIRKKGKNFCMIKRLAAAALSALLITLILAGCSAAGKQPDAKFPDNDTGAQSAQKNGGDASQAGQPDASQGAPSDAVGNQTGQPQAPENGSATGSQLTTPSGAPGGMYMEYLQIIEGNYDAMTLPDDLSTMDYPEMAVMLDIGGGKVDVRDLDGDGIPELIFLTHSQGYEEYLHIWSWFPSSLSTAQIFDQRVRSLAGGGGNYSVFVTIDGELYVYYSELSGDFSYGFWNVSAFLKENSTYDPAAYAFIGNSATAVFYCCADPDDPDASEYYLRGAAVSYDDAEIWLSDILENIKAVIMDSGSAKAVNHYDGSLIDIGLYTESWGPWRTYAQGPFKEECMSWKSALEFLQKQAS